MVKVRGLVGSKVVCEGVVVGDTTGVEGNP